MWLSKKNHPVTRGSYAVTTGVFAGEILIYIGTSPDQYDFLSIPKMINRSIPAEKFKLGLQDKIVEFVEIIPRSVYNICELQFKKNNNLSK